jgi:hypothetical protein
VGIGVIGLLAPVFLAYSDINSKLSRIEVGLSATERNLNTQISATEGKLNEKIDGLDKRLSRLEDRFNAKFGADTESLDGGVAAGCSYVFPDFQCPKSTNLPSWLNKNNGLLVCGMKGAAQNRAAVIAATNADGTAFASDSLYEVRASEGSKGTCGSPDIDHVVQFKMYVPPENPDHKVALLEIPPEAFGGRSYAYFCATARKGNTPKVSDRILVIKSCKEP